MLAAALTEPEGERVTEEELLIRALLEGLPVDEEQRLPEFDTPDDRDTLAERDGVDETETEVEIDELTEIERDPTVLREIEGDPDGERETAVVTDDDTVRLIDAV